MTQNICYAWILFLCIIDTFQVCSGNFRQKVPTTKFAQFLLLWRSSDVYLTATVQLCEQNSGASYLNKSDIFTICQKSPI